MLIFHKNQIYVPKYLRRRTLIWYHFYINHLGVEILANNLKKICYWKGITNQASQFSKRCKECKTQKKHALRYGQLPLKNIAEN